MNIPDRTLIILIAVLSLSGFVIFLSASLGLVLKEGAEFEISALKQFVSGGVVGLLALIFFAKLPYKFLRKYSFFIFLIGLFLTAAVFIPEVGRSHGGATRWLDVFGFSFQPAEFLKLAFVIYWAAWLARAKDRASTLKQGLFPFLAISGIAGAILVLQPDNDGFLILLCAGAVMYFVAGASLKHLGVLLVLGLALGALLLSQKPYLLKRLNTFIDPSADVQGASYQLNQSLIAVGSGGLSGRGFGRSLQKFEYLPEPTGDSIFAVAAEEFGFLGSAFLVAAFLLFALRSLSLSLGVGERFGEFLCVGIASLILIQSYINMASMLGLFPLSGTPLLFVSQGGTALILALVESGILLSVSRKVGVT